MCDIIIWENWCLTKWSISNMWTLKNSWLISWRTGGHRKFRKNQEKSWNCGSIIRKQIRWNFGQGRVHKKLKNLNLFFFLFTNSFVSNHMLLKCLQFIIIEIFAFGWLVWEGVLRDQPGHLAVSAADRWWQRNYGVHRGWEQPRWREFSWQASQRFWITDLLCSCSFIKKCICVEFIEQKVSHTMLSRVTNTFFVENILCESHFLTPIHTGIKAKVQNPVK